MLAATVTKEEFNQWVAEVEWELFKEEYFKALDKALEDQDEWNTGHWSDLIKEEK